MTRNRYGYTEGTQYKTRLEPFQQIYGIKEPGACKRFLVSLLRRAAQ